MQAASNVPVAIRCERSYVFSMVGRKSGDGITFTNNLVYRILKNTHFHGGVDSHFSIDSFHTLFIVIFICYYFFAIFIVFKEVAINSAWMR